MKTRIADIIRSHSTFEIISHEGPDEDSVGSSKALGLALASLGKAVCLVFPTPVPEGLAFTGGPAGDDIAKPEISLLVDLSDMAMLKGVVPRGKSVFIDHHRSEVPEAHAAWIDSSRSSTAEMIHELIGELHVPITPAIAENLFMGIFGDTGGFMHANTTASVFRIAHALVEQGADPHKIAYRLKKTKAFAFYRILCAAMGRMVVKEGVYASYVSLGEMESFRARPEDASGIVEEMAAIADARLIIFLRELQGGLVKASIRSKVHDAALRTASAFGGGGHGLAAGFTVKGRLEDVFSAVVQEGCKWIVTA